MEMQDKTISVIKLTEAKGKKPFRPFTFISTITTPVNRHIVAAIEEASDKDELPAVCYSLAAFKKDTKGAGGKDDIESWAGVFIDLDVSKGTRPDEAIPQGKLTKWIETEFPNTAAMNYPSYNNGAHVAFFYSAQCTDPEVNADTETMIRNKFFQSEYKEYLDDGTFTPERKIYVRKGTEPNIILGEGLDATKRYYESADERKAVEDNIKAYFKKKKKAEDKKEAKQVAEPVDDKKPMPHNKDLMALLKGMQNRNLTGEYHLADGWINVDAAKWQNANSITQWAIPNDCAQVNTFNGNVKEFDNIEIFVLDRIKKYDADKQARGEELINNSTTKVLIDAAKKIDVEAGKHKNTKGKKEDSELTSNETNGLIVRKIIQDEFKNCLSETGTIFFRKNDTENKATIFAINKHGYADKINGKMDFIRFFGEAMWDDMNMAIAEKSLKHYGKMKGVEREIDLGWQTIEIDGLTEKEYKKEKKKEELGKRYVITAVVIDAILVYQNEYVRGQPIKDRFTICNNNALIWDKDRLECWMSDKFLFDHKFNFINREDTKTIYVNGMNEHKELETGNIDMAKVDKSLTAIEKYIVNNGRLTSCGKWQGIFMSGLLMSSVMSSYLGIARARPVIGMKAHVGVGKSYLCRLLVSFLGEGFGKWHNGQITEASLRRELNRSGLVIVDDGMRSTDKYKLRLLQELIKSTYDNSRVAKMGVDSSMVQEYVLNCLLMFSGTLIPTDLDDNNREAISRMVMIEIKKPANENDEVSMDMKAGIEETIKSNDKQTTDNFIKFLISKVDDYDATYKRLSVLFNKKARELKITNADRRADLAAGLISGYIVMNYSKTFTDEWVINTFVEYNKMANERDDVFERIMEYVNKLCVYLRESHSEDIDEDGNVKTIDDVALGKSDEFKHVHKSGDKHINIPMLLDSNNKEIYTQYATWGVYIGKYAKNDKADYLFIKDTAPLYNVRCIGDTYFKGDKDTNVNDAISLFLQDDRFTHNKRANIYFYSDDKTVEEERISLRQHLVISIKDLNEMIVSYNKGNVNESHDDKSDEKNSDLDNSYDDVPF